MLSFTRRSGTHGDGRVGDMRGSGRFSRTFNVNRTSVQEKGEMNLVEAGGKQLGRADKDKFLFSEITSVAILESGVLGGGVKHIRVPQIVLAEYSQPLSRDKWFTDVFTLAHNAVRRECIDLYDMLGALGRCDGSHHDVNDEDINVLQRWWVVAHSLMQCYFKMEGEILLPWVDSAGSKEWEVQMALKKMRSLKDKLETLLGKVDRVWNEKTFKSAGEMFAMFYKTIDDFIPRLINYFADQEMLLPAIVGEFYKKEQG